MKVFIVHWFPVLDSDVIGVFSTREKARACMWTHSEVEAGFTDEDIDEHIEEVELDVPLLKKLDPNEPQD